MGTADSGGAQERLATGWTDWGSRLGRGAAASLHLSVGADLVRDDLVSYVIEDKLSL